MQSTTGKRTEREDSEEPDTGKRVKHEEGTHIFRDLGLPIPGRLTQTYTHLSAHRGTTTTTGEGYVLGVDEAGRGPVLGPMVYAACYCRDSYYDELSSLGFADSKQLTEHQRTQLFATLQTTQANAGWAVRCISPHDISTSMLRVAKYNLNAMAHDATIALLTQVLRYCNVTRVYVDTVGPPASYQRKLELLFPAIKFTVAKKADSLYPIVSAASVCAKVIRDAHLQYWVFPEPHIVVSRVFGSGYPGDPNTVKWLRSSVDQVFGYPDIIRFSWSTCAKLLDELAVPVLWPDDDDDSASRKNQKSNRAGTAKTIRGLFAAATTSSPNANRQRSKFFTRRPGILLNTTL
ncbi:hypothetical protein EV175_004553 [Coemansia sp. RSA 1933]|nr:hypothetical protein EV175_004553 [Coemansia sp. RSA 1933]